MTDWDQLPEGLREAMSPEFWASLSPEEQQARLGYPTDKISDEAYAAYKPEEPADG